MPNIKMSTTKNLNQYSKVDVSLRVFKRNLPLTLLALPSLVFIFIFNYVPLYGLVLPFKDYKASLGFFGSPWSGFKNFKFLFNSDRIFEITRNTIAMNFLFIIVGTVVAIIFALMLFELNKGQVKVYQTALFFPYFLSWVVVSYIAMTFLDMEYGFLNKILLLIGKTPVMWYNQPDFWPVILVIVAVWKGAGYGTVLYYAALMGVDIQYYEAAEIDGASKLKKIWNISLPMLQPLIIISLILQIGRIFYSDFGLFYNVTLDSSLLYPVTDVIDTYVFRAMKGLGDFGMASAANFYQSVVGFVLVILSNLAIKKINSDNAIF